MPLKRALVLVEQRVEVFVLPAAEFGALIVVVFGSEGVQVSTFRPLD